METTTPPTGARNTNWSLAPPRSSISSIWSGSRSHRRSFSRATLAIELSYLVTEPGEHVDGVATHTTGGAVDEDRTAFGALTVVLHAVNGNTGGKSGRADGHGFAQTEPLGQGHDPIAGHPRVLRIAAVMVLTQAATCHQHRIAVREARIV